MTCEYIEHPEQKLVEVVVDGKVTNEDMDRILPQMEAFIAAHGKVKILEVIKDFSGFDWGTIGRGFKFDMEHLKDFSHAAVVTNSGWIGPFTRILAPLFSVEIRTFKIAEESEAREWLGS